MRPRPLLLGLPTPLSARRRRPALALVLVLGLAMSPIVAASGIVTGARLPGSVCRAGPRAGPIRDCLRRRSRNRSGSPAGYPNARAAATPRAPRPRRRSLPTGATSRSRRLSPDLVAGDTGASRDVFVRDRASGV